MAKTIESWNKEWFFSWLKEFWEQIKNFFDEILNQAKMKINEMCGKEIFQVVETTKKKLSDLENEILNIDDNTLNNENIDDKELNLINKLKEKKDIFDFFNFLDNNITDNNLVKSEKILVLKMLKKISNNDSDDWKWDLTENEFNEILKYCQKKYSLINSLLQDDSLKNKQNEIFEVYNEILNKWETPTEELIKSKLKEKETSTDQADKSSTDQADGS